MHRHPNQHRAAPAAIALATLFSAAGAASAVPILGVFNDDPRCDPVNNITLTHELGELTNFPGNEAIFTSTQQTTVVICVPQDGFPNDWLVRMTNVSGIAWQDLFFVCDLGTLVGNADGHVIDLVNAPGVATDAFRIDGTVTPGMNANLVSESMAPDEIFAPGEVWEFYVSNFAVPAFANPVPQFVTPGLFAGSSNINAGTPGNASILANPVPEPSAAAVVALGALLPLRRRRRS